MNNYWITLDQSGDGFSVEATSVQDALNFAEDILVEEGVEDGEILGVEMIFD